VSADRSERLVRPLFVIAPPGSGAEQLVNAIAQAEGMTSLRSAPHPLAAMPALHPAQRGFDSARLGRADARPTAIAALEAAWQVSPGDRLVATWDEIALQVPFLAAAWPDASFVYLHRDPLDTLGWMRSAWRTGEATTHPDLPDWAGPAWSGPLVPGWRALPTGDLIPIVAAQWSAITELAVAEIARQHPASWLAVSQHQVSANPEGPLHRIGGAFGLTWSHPPVVAEAPAGTPLTADDLGEDLARVADLAQRARDLLDHRAGAPAAEADPTTGFESRSTPNVAELLTLLDSTLVATTYQSGRVVLLRAREGMLNTHFRAFPKPMGIAYRDSRLALGTRSEVWTMVEVPGMEKQAGPPHDAVFVPRTMQTTGDIRIHDIGWVGDELWAVNTRFSCLVTFDGTHSFVPRWKPAFITALAAEDRCHLNGMAIVDGRVKYVTALGTTDTPGGWRPRKADGGVIIDVETDRIIASGLSMPHSPRWHDGRLWVLESGEGSLARVDPATGEVTTVATLPGFTRGLTFAGRYAFVGLSQVREATTFGGLPLTARLEDRRSGVWIVDIETGQTMGFVQFEGRVEEIFDLELLPRRFPDLLEPGTAGLESTFVMPA